MDESLHIVIASKLEEIGPTTAVAFEVKIDNYFDAVRGLLDDFLSGKDLVCVYVTASVPSSTLHSALQALEVKVESIRYVDCISHTLMASTGASDNTAFVESPTMLENILLKVEYFSRLAQGRRMLVVVDSMNSFALHNDLKMLSQFLSILTNMLKAKEAYPVLLAIPDQLRPEAREMMGMVCDVIVPL
jgi:KaiC/GvpD/RAD55 family RecA-like ATPase